MALKYKDVDKEVKDNQAIYKLATENGLNIAQARNQYYGQNDALTQAAAVATSKNTGTNKNVANTNYTPTVANYSPTYGNNNNMTAKGDAGLPTAVQDQIKYNQQQWLRGQQTGNQKQMDAAHAAAEALRSGYGYLGGADGSQYLKQTDQYGDFSFQSAPVFFDRYGNQITEQRDKILNRKDFSYNPEEDALYQQLRAQYNREGNRAMKNTLGEVSARTGGLASSYAGTAATQANQYYAQQLADRIPELQQLAYSMYMDDLNNDRADLSMLESASDRDYGRYNDTYNRWYGERDFAYGSHWDNKNYDRGVFESDRNYGLEREKLDETIKMNNISIDQWNQADATQKAEWMISAGFVPSPELLDAAKISVENATSMANQVQDDRAIERQQATRSSSGGSGGSNSNMMTRSQALQYYGDGSNPIKTEGAINAYVAYDIITPEKGQKWLNEIGGASATGGGDLTWDDVKEAFGGKEIDMDSITTEINGTANPDSLLHAYEAGEVDVVVEGNTVRVVKKNNEPRNRGQNGLLFGYNGHR